MNIHDTKRILVLVMAAGVAGYLGAGLASAEGDPAATQQSAQPAQPTDTAPGPAFVTIDGTVSKIEGEIYTVQQAASNEYVSSGVKANEYRVYVGKETKKIGGEKKVGDRIRAEVTRGGFANSIQ